MRVTLTANVASERWTAHGEQHLVAVAPGMHVHVLGQRTPTAREDVLPRACAGQAPEVPSASHTNPVVGVAVRFHCDPFQTYCHVRM